MKYLLFFLTAYSALTFAQSTDEQCKQRIGQIFCIYDKNGNCHKDIDEKYIPFFKRAYDTYPDKLKNFLCKVNKLGVRDMNGSATAYSDLVFRQGIMDKNLDATHWATWKDQLNFGVSNDDSFPTDNGLPTVELKNKDNDEALHFILLHEIGHWFSSTKSPNENGQWAQFQSFSGNDFPNRNKLCSYWCKGQEVIRGQAILDVYYDLYNKSNFISLYAARNAEEDFADSFAFVIYKLLKSEKYLVHLPNGETLDILAKIDSKEFHEKFDFVRTIYSNHDPLTLLGSLRADQNSIVYIE